MIDIAKGILCDACGKKWEKGDAQYSFRLNATGKKDKVMQKLFKRADQRVCEKMSR